VTRRASAGRLIRFHTLRHEQWVPRPLEHAWAFFSNARNLEAITPPWLGFRVLDTGPIRMQAGTLIRYRIRWHGVPIGWATRIRGWDPPRRFTDVQESGPYALWHHSHRFAAKDGGTQISDVVRYRLPCGLAGRMAHALRVDRDLKEIFKYRHERVQELLGDGADGDAR